MEKRAYLPEITAAEDLLGKLSEIADNWLRIARRKFVDAETETEPEGKRLVEHGALCYMNCADELKAALNADALRPSTSQQEGRT